MGLYHLGDYVVTTWWGAFRVEVASALLFHGKTYGYFRGGLPPRKTPPGDTTTGNSTAENSTAGTTTAETSH